MDQQARKQRGRAEITRELGWKLFDRIYQGYLPEDERDPNSAGAVLARELNATYVITYPTADEVVRMIDDFARDLNHHPTVRDYYRDASDRAIQLLANEILGRAEQAAAIKIGKYEARKAVEALMNKDVHDVDVFEAQMAMAKHPDIWQGRVELVATKEDRWMLKFDQAVRKSGITARERRFFGDTPLSVIAQGIVALCEERQPAPPRISHKDREDLSPTNPEPEVYDE